MTDVTWDQIKNKRRKLNEAMKDSLNKAKNEHGESSKIFVRNILIRMDLLPEN